MDTSALITKMFHDLHTEHNTGSLKTIADLTRLSYQSLFKARIADAILDSMTDEQLRGHEPSKHMLGALGTFMWNYWEIHSYGDGKGHEFKKLDVMMVTEKTMSVVVEIGMVEDENTISMNTRDHRHVYIKIRGAVCMADKKSVTGNRRCSYWKPTPSSRRRRK